nr:hypothetical protein [uncultured Clostridium sp.]
MKQGLEQLPNNTTIKAMLEKITKALQNNNGTTDAPSSAESAAYTSTPELANTPLDDAKQAVDAELRAEQLAFLEPLEEAMLAYDMGAAFPILQSAEFQEICRSLPEADGNTYKYDDNDEWMIAYWNSAENGESFQIDLVTDWENGNIYLAETHYRIDGGNYGDMMTYDVVDGKVNESHYNGISAYYLDGQLIIE